MSDDSDCVHMVEAERSGILFSPTPNFSPSHRGALARASFRSFDVTTTTLENAGLYDMNPWTLTYTSTEIETRFCKFLYVTSGFYGGKFWHAAAIGLVVMILACYHGFSMGLLTGYAWLPLVISGLAAVVTFVALAYADSRWRETVTLISLAMHWPAYSMMMLHGVQDSSYSYPAIVGCQFFCAGVSNVRVSRLSIVMLVPTTLTLIGSCWGIAEYWKNHMYIEIMYWLFPLFPLGIARIWERRLRASFQRIDVAQMELRSIQENVTVMHNTVASFFPSTPTMRMIVLPPVPVQESVFPRTVLIVTDLVGFTSWTTRTSLRDVVDTLSNMFTEMHEVAQHLHVEKISTVGDSFVGVIFETSGDMMDTSGERCILGIQFGVSVLELGGALKMRVGVHIGDVVGGFVGFSPPQFDIFSPHLDRAKALESTGSPSRIHVSHEVYNAATARGGAPIMPQLTRDGMLLEGWERSMLTSSTRSVLESSSRPVVDGSHANKICDTLMEQRRNGCTVYSPSPVHTHRKEYAICYLRLQFVEEDMETEYIRWLRKSKVHKSALYVLIGMEICLWCVHVILGCTDTIQDKIIVVCVLLCCLSYYVYLERFELGRYTPVITFLTFAFPTFITTFMTNECARAEDIVMQSAYTTQIHAFYFVMNGLACEYSIEVPFLKRLFVLLFLDAVAVAEIPLRHTVYPGDKSFPYDYVYLILPGAYATLSYSCELILRRGYQAQLRVEVAIGQTGSYAKFLRQSMDLMVPEFVTTKILQHHRREEVHDSILWEYPNIGAMFVSFHPTMKPDGKPHTIDVRTILESLERVALDNKLIKVKSVGTSMLCVCGLTTNPRDTSMQENALALCTAAQQMVRALEHCPNVTYKVGLHSGPCFGVVLGSAAVTFDVFGDTINTASRMHTSAPSNTVQLSAVVMECMEDAEFPDAIFTPLTAMVEIRGKGYMHVYSMKDAVRTPNLKVDNDYEFII